MASEWRYWFISRQKEEGEGNSAQVAVPDVALLNEDDKEVKILIEVESSSDFKQMLHCIGPIAMADVYSPTYKYSPKAKTKRPNYSLDGNDYFIKKIILFILVLCEDRKQFKEMIKQSIQISSKNEPSDNNDSKIMMVYFDSDSDPTELANKFKRKLETIISNNEFEFNLKGIGRETKDS